MMIILMIDDDDDDDDNNNDDDLDDNDYDLDEDDDDGKDVILLLLRMASFSWEAINEGDDGALLLLSDITVVDIGCYDIKKSINQSINQLFNS